MKRMENWEIGRFTESNKMLEKYRDLFLVGCYTGLRWEDYKSIKKDDFSQTNKGTPVLIVRTAKTGIRVVIPILWRNFNDILRVSNLLGADTP